MHKVEQSHAKSIGSQIIIYALITLGTLLAALALEVFLFPNRLIDGGVVGIGMILANLFGQNLLPLFLLGLNLPFIYFGYRALGKVIVIHMLFANITFAGFLALLHRFLTPHFVFTGESLEVVVIGGAILGIGLGLIIRHGACLDGTEVLGIIINKKTGLTVGQVVLACNIVIFGAAGIVFQDWHPPLLSLIMYIVAVKIMDAVIVGLDETKSVWIISAKSKEITQAIVHELGLGLTIMYGKGGYSGEDREILYVIAERLQLSELKELIHREDPSAFVAIENLHEVTNASKPEFGSRKKRRIEKIMSQILKPPST